jgi:hypothetical protein
MRNSSTRRKDFVILDRTAGCGPASPVVWEGGENPPIPILMRPLFFYWFSLDRALPNQIVHDKVPAVDEARLVTTPFLIKLAG